MKIKNNLHKFKHIFFVGIGGISLSGLAKWCLHSNIKVSGSDICPNHLTKNLQRLGAKIFNKHSAKNIDKTVDLIVFTSAIKQNNPELKYAKKHNILTMERAVFLNEVANNYKNVIAIAGMHGKTTTCGMMASVFICAKLNPTVHIGGESAITDGNFKIGNKKFFITEACEYKNNFLKFQNDVAVILNIEMDHPDCYKNIESIYDSFSQFANNSKKLCVVNEKFKSSLKLNKNLLTFNFDGSADFYAKNILVNENGKISFDCFKNNQFFGNFCLNVFGKHNVLNALAVICVADYFEILPEHIKQGLKNFSGIKRRFEHIATINECDIIHDYAHHPTEIKTTIECAKQVFKKNIICVFQPHTYSRTKRLINEFLTCFNDCNEIIIAKTYSAREKFFEGMSGKTLAKKLERTTKSVSYIPNFENIYSYLLTKANKNNIILILGAGNVEQLAQMFKP